MSDNSGELIKKGGILFVQGENPKGIYMLQSGSLEILSASSDYNGLDRDIIVSHSRRVGTIKGKSLLSGFSNLFVNPYEKTIRAIEDSHVVKYPLQSGGFKGILTSDQSQAASILKQLFTRLNLTIQDVDKFTKLHNNICRVNDNFGLIYKELSVTNAADNLDIKSSALHESFTANGGSFPGELDAKFLVTDNSKFLSKKYNYPGVSFGLLQNNEGTGFIKRFLMLDQQLFMSIIKADPMIGLKMYSMLYDEFLKGMDMFESTYDDIHKELNDLFGGRDSWSSYLVEDGCSEWENSGRLNGEFVKNLLTLIVKINSSFEDLTGKKISDEYPGIKMIHKFYTSKKNEPAPVQGVKTEIVQSGRTGIGANKELKNSIHQIFEFAMVDKEFQTSFLKLLNEFKNMKNPYSTESEGRKIRRHLTKYYWDVYKQIYIRSKAEKRAPLPVRLMINFGFMDETLMDEHQIVELCAVMRKRDVVKEIPVLYEHEFLNKIYLEEEIPSITEMGLTYKAFLREEEKHSKKKDSGEIIDENLKKTMYEIDQRLKSTAGVCSGSTATAFPILNSHILKGSITGAHSSKQKVEGIVKEIMDTDLSAFFRETVLKLGESREIIKEEIIPYFILLPICGTRTLLWQDLSGTDKRSRGRIVIPMFFIGDLKKNIAHTVACFRWELNRTIKGQAMWADPIDGGITGEYFDYVNTFKKNPNLSSEAKEKIAIRFKSLRTNRDRFAEDYLMWVLFEKNGIMKLNSIVRSMFYKHIPFRKEIRDKLENMPAFSHSANRYKNVTAKTYQGYQRRFKKYQDSEGKYPPAIEKFMEFLLL